jgi:WD40 repeat protein
VTILVAAYSIGWADTPSYVADIAPILTKYCAGCHNADDLEGDLSFESFDSLARGGEHGPVLFPGNGEASRLIQVLTGTAELKMPPEGEPQPSPADIDKLRKWIESGAPGPDGESPPITRLAVPELAPSLSAKPITAVAFSPDGRFLAVARFRSVELRTADASRLVALLNGAVGKINSVSFTPDGRRLLVASGIGGLKGELCIWDIAAAQIVQKLYGHRDIIYSAIPSPDGKWIATGSYDRTIILWDANSGKAVRTISGHNGAIYDQAFSSDSRILASASADATVKIWDVQSGERLDTLSQPLKEQYSVAISPDNEYVFACGEDNRIRKWHLISKDQPRINPLLIARFGHEQAVERLEVSPDGRFVVSVSADRTLKVWDAERLTQLQMFDAQPDTAQALAIDPHSNRIAVGRMDGSLELYDLPPSTRSVERPKSIIVQAVRPADSAPSAREFAEVEPNDSCEVAQTISLPASVRGVISEAKENRADVDLFKFSSRAGWKWIFEIRAARDKSPLDSHLAILDRNGNPVPRVLLQAVRDSYFTFRGKDSQQVGDFRVHNWQEMKVNQYLYASGEVVKLYHYPRGPDSGFNVYPNFGNRHGFFDTTPLAHALGEPCYIVEPHPPGTALVPNGLPAFELKYENDDASTRQLGTDSQLTFVAPADGEYHVAVRDVRDFGGDDFKYELLARIPKPDFGVTITDRNPTVASGAGRKFGIEIERLDGFDAEVRIDIERLPPGFSVTTPIVVEASQLRAFGTVFADPDAVAPSADIAKSSVVRATALVDGQMVTKEVGSLGEIKLGERSKVAVQLTSDPSAGATNPTILEIVPGTTTTASLRISRHGQDGAVSFGNEEAVANMPHGVYVGNIGLNGVLIPGGQTERTIFIVAEPWVQPSERWVFIEADTEQKPTSPPILMRIVPRADVASVK